MTTDKNSLSDREVMHRIEELRNDLKQDFYNLSQIIVNAVAGLEEESIATKFLLNRVAEKLGIDVKNEEKKDLK